MAKIHTMAEAVSPGGKSLIIMSSAKRGNAGADLKDLKLGKHTASGTDQTRRGTGAIGTTTKTLQHDWMDVVSGSRKRGFRDEDAWQSAAGSDKVFNADSVARANVVPLTNMFANSPPAALDAIKRDLTNIKQWLQRTDTVYVGMSVLVVSNREQPNASNATTIDFEHPIWRTDASFETHRQGMLEGVDNILALVEQALQSLPPQPVPRANPMAIPGHEHEQPIQIPGQRSEPIPIPGREEQDRGESEPISGSPDFEESALIFSLEF